MLSQGLRVPFLDHLGIPPKRSKSGGLGFLAAHRPYMSRTKQIMIEDEAYGAWTGFSQMMNSCGSQEVGGSQRKHGLPTPLPHAMVWTSI